MGPLAAFGVWLADRAEHSDGHRFQDPTSATAPADVAPGASRTASAATGTAGLPAGYPPHPAGTGLITTRPGAGQHANGCLYLDDVWHRCVNESGQPSNLVCHASEYHRNNIRSIHPAGRDNA